MLEMIPINSSYQEVEPVQFLKLYLVFRLQRTLLYLVLIRPFFYLKQIETHTIGNMNKSVNLVTIVFNPHSRIFFIIDLREGRQRGRGKGRWRGEERERERDRQTLVGCLP